MDASEQDLTMRLELARRNSQNQNGHDYHSPAIQEPAEDTIYEGMNSVEIHAVDSSTDDPVAYVLDDPPPAQRPLSRMSRTSRALPEPPQDYDYAASQRSTTPTIRAHSPFLDNDDDRYSRPLSRNSSDRSERRPLGPRSPSPLPIASPSSGHARLPSMDSDTEAPDANGYGHGRGPAHGHAASPATPPRQVFPRTPIPRSKRQPFEPTNVPNTDTTPRPASTVESVRPPSIIEPLSIKKRTSVRTNASAAGVSPVATTPLRKSPLVRRPSPMGKGAFSGATARRVSGQRITAAVKPPVAAGAVVEGDLDLDELEQKVKRAAEATKADVRVSLQTKKTRRSVDLRRCGRSSPRTARSSGYASRRRRSLARRPFARLWQLGRRDLRHQ